MSAVRPLSRRFPNAAIVYASVYAFRPGEKILQTLIESRAIIWCKAGAGLVTVNGQTYPFEADRYIVLPWRHGIKYEASTSDPFFLAAIHLIPNHHTNKRISFHVAHDEKGPLARAAFRRDIPIPALARMMLGRLEAHAPLTHLIEYIVELFRRGDPEEAMARHLARQLLHELVLSGQNKEVHDHGVPSEVERMKHYILANLHRPLSLSHLVEFTQLSPHRRPAFPRASPRHARRLDCQNEDGEGEAPAASPAVLRGGCRHPSRHSRSLLLFQMLQEGNRPRSAGLPSPNPLDLIGPEMVVIPEGPRVVTFFADVASYADMRDDGAPDTALFFYLPPEQVRQMKPTMCFEHLGYSFRRFSPFRCSILFLKNAIRDFVLGSCITASLSFSKSEFILLR